MVAVAMAMVESSSERPWRLRLGTRETESWQLRLAIGDAEAEVGLVLCGFAWSARDGALLGCPVMPDRSREERCG